MRIFWLDNLKTVGILLVVLGHMLPESPLKQYIYSFHVPLFFFASGYCFDPDKYDFKTFLRRKFQTRIIPYLFFSVLSLLFWYFIVRRLSLSGRALAIDPVKPLIGLFYGVGSGQWRSPMNIALWFLPCLFSVEIIFYLARRPLTLLMFAALGYATTMLPLRLPLSLDVALSALVFFGLGYYYRDWRLPRSALPVLLACNLGFCFLNSPVDMNNLSYGNIPLFYAAACSGVLGYSELCRRIKKNALSEYVGSNTIIFIGFVGISLFILNGIEHLVFGKKIVQSGYAYFGAAIILQLVLTIPAVYGINKWFPAMLGRRRPAFK